jgi:hypothetical protein
VRGFGLDSSGSGLGLLAALENTATNLRVPEKTGNFLTS